MSGRRMPGQFAIKRARIINPLFMVQVALGIGMAFALVCIWVFCLAQLSHDLEMTHLRSGESVNQLSLTVADDADRASRTASSLLLFALADAQKNEKNGDLSANWAQAMAQRARQTLAFTPEVSQLQVYTQRGLAWSATRPQDTSSLLKATPVPTMTAPFWGAAASSILGADATRMNPSRSLSDPVERPESAQPSISWSSIAQEGHGEWVVFTLPPVPGAPLRLAMLSGSAQDPQSFMAVATLDRQRFYQFWKQLNLGSNGMVALVDLDGRIRARWAAGYGLLSDSRPSDPAFLQAVLGHKNQNGQNWFVSPLDQEKRLYAWQYRESQPFIPVAALGEEQILSAYNAERRVAMSAAGAMTILLIIGGLWLLAVLSRWNRASDAAKKANAIFNSSPEPMALLSVDQVPKDEHSGAAGWSVSRANRAMEELLRMAPGELNRRGLAEALDAALANTLANAASRSLLQGQSSNEETVLGEGARRQDVQWTFAPTQTREGRDVAVIGKNVSLQRSAQQSLEKLAHFDPLTGLPNRVWFAQCAQEWIVANPAGASLAVLFIDLDDFKIVNDTKGHAVGDALLVEVARRARRALPERDMLARLGGDEFVALLETIESSEDALRRAQLILDTLTLPIAIDGHVFHVGASIGIALWPEHGLDLNALMKHADTAMYKAKGGGKNRVTVFEDAMQEGLQKRVKMETRLREAIETRGLRLAWQAQVSLRDGSLASVEALARWTDSQLGEVLPFDFIPVAENAGLIEALGEWVFDESCRQVRQWLDAGVTPPLVSFNVSPIQLRNPDLAKTLLECCSRHGLHPSLFEAELTESSLLEQAELAASLLQSLRASGMKVAIDDFGVGYSSLAYLAKFEVDTIKLDRSFVEQIGSSASAQAIIQAICSFARAVGARSVAEGVEREEQRDWLQKAGCDVGQGFLFSRPQTAEAFELRLPHESGLSLRAMAARSDDVAALSTNTQTSLIIVSK